LLADSFHLSLFTILFPLHPLPLFPPFTIIPTRISFHPFFIFSFYSSPSPTLLPSLPTLYQFLVLIRLPKIKEWVDSKDPHATIIPFSGAFELKVKGRSGTRGEKGRGSGGALVCLYCMYWSNLRSWLQNLMLVRCSQMHGTWVSMFCVHLVLLIVQTFIGRRGNPQISP